MNTAQYLVSTGAARLVPAVGLMPGDVLVEADGYQAEIATVEVDGRHMVGTLKPGMGIADPKTFRVLARAEVLVAEVRREQVHGVEEVEALVRKLLGPVDVCASHPEAAVLSVWVAASGGARLPQFALGHLFDQLTKEALPGVELRIYGCAHAGCRKGHAAGDECRVRA